MCAAPSARAQSRVGVVEIAPAGPTGPNGSLSSSLTPGGVPQLVTLNLAAPSLALAPAPAAAPYAAVSPLPAALAPARAPVPAVLTPGPLPLAAIPVAPGSAFGARTPAGSAAGTIASDPERSSVAELLENAGRLFGENRSGRDLDIDATNRLFAPSSKPGVMSSQYLRLEEPFQFGASEVFRYRTALNAYGAKDGGEATETLLAAAEALAASAGIKTERGMRSLSDGTMRPVLKIAPQLRGHRLNRLAWDLARGYGAGVEYSPERTRGGTAAYNGLDNVLFLPDFGSEKAFEAILHESRHASFAKRLRNGDVSVFHGALVAYAGRDIAPGAMSYDNYMSFEELSTHVKTLLHTIIRAQRGGGDEAASQAKTYAFQLIDVLRSAEINLYQLKRRLEKGEVASSRVEGSPTFRDFKGGHWELINLPHAMLLIPVRDEAPAPKPSLWNRLFKDKPETAGVRAARRQVEALRPMIEAVGGELENFLGALKGDEPDLKKARASASRMTSLAAKAEKAFQSP